MSQNIFVELSDVFEEIRVIKNKLDLFCDIIQETLKEKKNVDLSIDEIYTLYVLRKGNKRAFREIKDGIGDFSKNPRNTILRLKSKGYMQSDSRAGAQALLMLTENGKKITSVFDGKLEEKKENKFFFLHGELVTIKKLHRILWSKQENYVDFDLEEEIHKFVTTLANRESKDIYIEMIEEMKSNGNIYLKEKEYRIKKPDGF